MERYSIIKEKNPREIVLLRGKGCAYRGCTFCDYHLDASMDEEENFKINKEQLDKVTGVYHHLEVINSGSFTELDERTRQYILSICHSHGITLIHFECHYLYRNEVSKLRREFANLGIEVKVKIGVETFDEKFREEVLHKGIRESKPEIIAEQFDEVCLLFGLTGQTEESMRFDIETGLRYFERVCLNIMVENSTKVKPDKEVVRVFMDKIYPDYQDDYRVDILINNTDFGVGTI